VSGGPTVMWWRAVHTVVSDATTATAAAHTDWIAASVLASTYNSPSARAEKNHGDQPRSTHIACAVPQLWRVLYRFSATQLDGKLHALIWYQPRLYSAATFTPLGSARSIVPHGWVASRVSATANADHPDSSCEIAAALFHSASGQNSRMDSASSAGASSIFVK
jgi:hypothetical protein